MAIVAYDSSGTIHQLLCDADDRQPQAGFSTLSVDEAANDALLADMIANWRQYTAPGGVLTKAGQAVTIAPASLDTRLAGLGGKLLAAVAFRASASWATATTAQKAKVQAIIDGVGAAVANILDS